MRIPALILALALITGCAHTSVNTGELWEVWTHSEKQEECIAKTVFWMVLVIAVIYVIVKYSDKKWGKGE